MVTSARASTRSRCARAWRGRRCTSTLEARSSCSRRSCTRRSTRSGERSSTVSSGLEETSDLEASLLEIARALIAVAIEPRLLDLRRLVIGEVGRFPNLGRAYYDRGPGRTVEVLAEKFKELGDRTVLNLDDVELAAQQFNWLVLSIPINRAMFDPEARFSDAELRRYSREAVRTFLAAYG